MAMVFANRFLAGHPDFRIGDVSHNDNTVGKISFLSGGIVCIQKMNSIIFHNFVFDAGTECVIRSGHFLGIRKNIFLVSSYIRSIQASRFSRV